MNNQLVEKAFWKTLIISMFTLGIYGIIFMISYIRDLNILCAGDGKETPGVGKVIGLSIITCGIYGLLWTYNMGNRVQENGPRYGLEIKENGTFLILYCFIPVVGSFYSLFRMIENQNAMIAVYNTKQSAA